MSIDISFIENLKDHFLSMLQGRGEELIYMQRFRTTLNMGYCPRCGDWDEKLETDPRCPVCYGTGWFGGWALPVTGINSPYQRAYGILSYGNVLGDFAATGFITETVDLKLNIAINEEPHPADLIIDAHKGMRYLVGNSVKDWSFAGAHIGWNITVNLQATTDIVYSVPIPAYDAILSGGRSEFSSRMALELELPTRMDLVLSE